MPTASSRKAQSAQSFGGSSGVSGIGVKGTVSNLAGSLRMMPDGQVSTKVSTMYAEKRDPATSSDENLGRWILGGVILLAIGAGVWYWQKRQADKEEAP